MLRKMMLGVICLLMICVGIVVALPPAPVGGGPPGGGGGSNWHFGVTKFVKMHKKYYYLDPDHEDLSVKYGVFDNTTATLTQAITINNYSPVQMQYNGNGYVDGGVNNGEPLDSATAFDVSCFEANNPVGQMFTWGLTPYNSTAWDGGQCAISLQGVPHEVSHSHEVIGGQEMIWLDIEHPHTWFIPEYCDEFDLFIGVEWASLEGSQSFIPDAYTYWQQQPFSIYKLAKGSQEGFECFRVAGSPTCVPSKAPFHLLVGLNAGELGNQVWNHWFRLVIYIQTCEGGAYTVMASSQPFSWQHTIII